MPFVDRLESAARICTLFETPAFHVQCKTMWDKERAQWVMETVMPTLTHRCDGLLFTPADMNGYLGRFPNLLKWKDAGGHTVDFALVPIRREPLLVGLAVLCQEEFAGNKSIPSFSSAGGKLLPYAQSNNLKTVCVLEDAAAQMAALGITKEKVLDQEHPLIVECGWSAEPLQEDLAQEEHWKLRQVRADKLAPNGNFTYDRTRKNILECICLEEVYRACEAR